MDEQLSSIIIGCMSTITSFLWRDEVNRKRKKMNKTHKDKNKVTKNKRKWFGCQFKGTIN